LSGCGTKVQRADAAGQGAPEFAEREMAELFSSRAPSQ